MITPNNEKAAVADQQKPSPKTPMWKRLLKITLGLALIIVLAVVAFIGSFIFRYQLIVRARPGNLQTQAQPLEIGKRVNPFIGTGGFPWMCGDNFPGAMTPFGMVRLGPETVSIQFHKRAANTSGYHYGDDQVLGFSHTRLNGTGATDGGHFLVMPALQDVNLAALRKGQTTTFSHSNELASPGYYAVKLPKLGVLAELTASPRVGVHRYTFSEEKTPHLIIDVMNAMGGHKSNEGMVRVLPEAQEVEGSVRTFGTFASRNGGIKVYFVARFNQPFAGFATWLDDAVSRDKAAAEGNRVGVDLSFAGTNRPQVVTLKLAISYVSLENARNNLQTEARDKDFDQIMAEAQKAWEERLGSIRIQGGTDDQKANFYTALFRAFQMPTLFNDANGDYLGFDNKVHKATGFQYFTDMSLWDTFRTAHPLYTLIAPKDQRDMIMSLMQMLEQGGWLPRWPSGRGYSNSMEGTPADIMITDSYLKGIRDFDVEKAYQAMRLTALGPTPPGARFSGREGITEYLKYGYCPAGLIRKSVALTLEYSWSDYAISRLAEALGHTDDAALFRKHAQSYRQVWNPETQYFQPRDAEGKFVEPFQPLLLTYMDRKGELTKDYVEGDAMQWRWGAPYDAEGLVSLFKSREYFINELDTFFAKSEPGVGAWTPGSYYWHGNEPDIHAVYLFNAAGRPDLTQKWVRWILEHKYANRHDGLDGNDDGGTLSAWYVLSALGLYPVPGTDKYELASPLFEKAEVKLKNKPLLIVAENYAPDRFYARKVFLNDTPLDRPWIKHSEIENGGVLRFVMDSEPAKH
jgi:predicted alpha-1,2-mannosidase